MLKKIVLVILAVAVSILITQIEVRTEPESSNIEPLKIEEKIINNKDIGKVEIVKKIANTFPENKEVMVAIAIEESNLNPNAIGYNCFYKLGGETYDTLIKRKIDLNSVSKTRLTNYVSTFCRKGHEKYSWSQDGGIMGINGAKAHEMNVDQNLLKAKKIYSSQGITAWTSYKTGRYKANLAEAQRLLNLL